MTKPGKKERKKLIQEWAAEENAKLKASMPITPEQLNNLLDYLDANLITCDQHSFKVRSISRSIAGLFPMNKNGTLRYKQISLAYEVTFRRCQN